MKPVVFLTASVACFAVGGGAVIVATPQAGLRDLGLDSQALGLLVAGLPIGYALGCLALGRLFRRAPEKHVLMGGVLVSLAAILVMVKPPGAAAALAAQAVYGLASGAYWPFASAWMLGCRTEGLRRTTLLRCYNVGWTGGTALGMFAAGLLCGHGWIGGAYLFGAAATLGAFLLALFPPALPRIREAGAAPDAAPGARAAETPRSIGLGPLLAAASANLLVLGTGAVIAGNYAELNAALGFGAERMGLLVAVALTGQLLAFLFGAAYEPWLGTRRIYAALAAGLLVICLTFACTPSLPALLLAVVLKGCAAALAFQSGLLAATQFFASPRAGTTFHEAVVGAAGGMPILAGWLVASCRSAGHGELESLRAPFLALAAAAGLVLLAQVALVSRARRPRALLAAAARPEGL